MSSSGRTRAAAPLAGGTTRRADIRRTTLGVGAGLLSTALPAGAQDSGAIGSLKLPGQAFCEDHEPLPLAFDASKLKGLSARLLESHWSNNYGGSVRALNEVNRRLSTALSDGDLSAFVYNDLKREHLTGWQTTCTGR